ncbi:MAG: diadenylate cyclase CdaA [Clostridia bacterium]|nr:diadenylate cyclase CdaA [Clostridia bacterium]
MSFDGIVKAIGSGLSQFSVLDALDILIMTFLIYKLIMLTKETRAYQVLKGFGILFLAAALTQLFGLTSLNWLLTTIVQSGILVAVILFQPELRRAFEHIGRGKLFDHGLFSHLNSNETPGAQLVEELTKAIFSMARRRVGALIVIEQKVGLGDIISSGTMIEGRISGALIENIFEPNTPLHDGATIIRDGSIVAAGCFLPLSDDITLARELGTRHRAALGISNVSDSITIVVSEETGVISIAREGKLIRYIDSRALKDLLEGVFVRKEKESGALNLAWLKRRTKHEE